QARPALPRTQIPVPAYRPVPHIQQRPHPPPAHRPSPAPARDRPMPQGYGSRSRPIVIDRQGQQRLRQENKCFNCQEVGHFAKECPHPKRNFNVRALAMNLTDEERLEMLAALQESEVEPETPAEEEVTPAA